MSPPAIEHPTAIKAVPPEDPPAALVDLADYDASIEDDVTLDGQAVRATACWPNGAGELDIFVNDDAGRPAGPDITATVTKNDYRRLLDRIEEWYLDHGYADLDEVFSKITNQETLATQWRPPPGLS